MLVPFLLLCVVKQVSAIAGVVSFLSIRQAVPNKEELLSVNVLYEVAVAYCTDVL